MRPVLGSICGDWHVEPLPHAPDELHRFGDGRDIDDEGIVTVGLLTLELYLEGTASLKEKRSRIAPAIRRIRTKFNASVCESDAQDVLHWVLDARLDVEVLDSHVELIA